MNVLFYTGNMKRILFFVGLIATMGCTQAQTTSQPAQATTPPVVQPKPNIDKIPAFKILTQDSVYVTNSILKKDKATVIIYFSPDCSHCQRMMYELKPYMKDFANSQVIMVTFIQNTPPYMNLLREFRRDFNLKAYPNFITGTEFPDYRLQRYYQVATTPYIAIYDKKGKLFKTFDKVPKTIEEFVDAVKKV